MTARGLPRPEVTLAQNDALLEGGLFALYALGPVLANGRKLAREDLLLTKGPVTLTGDWPVLSVRFQGLPDL